MTDVPEPTPEQVAALEAGRVAYARGQPSGDCPYNSDEPGLQVPWVRGWVVARTATVYAEGEGPPTDRQLTAMVRWRSRTLP